MTTSVDVSYDPSMVTALQHGTWMDDEGFKKTCIKEKKKRGGIHQPLYGFEHIERSAKLLDYFLRSNKSNINQYIGSGLHAETGCRKVYAGKVFEEQKKSHGIEGDDWEWQWRLEGLPASGM